MEASYVAGLFAVLAAFAAGIFAAFNVALKGAIDRKAGELQQVFELQVKALEARDAHSLAGAQALLRLGVESEIDLHKRALDALVDVAAAFDDVTRLAYQHSMMRHSDEDPAGLHHRRIMEAIQTAERAVWRGPPEWQTQLGHTLYGLSATANQLAGERDTDGSIRALFTDVEKQLEDLILQWRTVEWNRYRELTRAAREGRAALPPAPRSPQLEAESHKVG